MLKEDVREKTLSPQQVRAILNADNKEIVALCKRASIMPRKNNKGQTYFSYDEVRHLRKLQAKKSLTSPVAVSTSPQVSSASLVAPVVQKQSSVMMKNILVSLKDMETKLSDRIAKVIDEKLEGMDEVVVELIRCKTDNETLRQKIIDLNKEIYQLKNDLNSFKPVGLGLYKKKQRNVWE